MQAEQLLFWEEVFDSDYFRKEIDKLSEAQKNLRKGIFQRYDLMQREIDMLKEEIDLLKMAAL